jgi:opacity protein-like surface antigen
MPRTAVLVFAVLALVATAAPAVAQQSLSLNIGYLALRGEGGRVAGDTIVANLNADPPFALGYQVSDFNNVTVGAEWLIPLGNFLEVGTSVNYYSATVPSHFRDLTNQDGSEITQTLKLRTVPVTGTLRFVLTGRHAPVQPYVGAGVAIVPWNYSEIGDAKASDGFVDANFNVFQWEYKSSGTAVGAVFFGGLRVALNRKVALGGEFRYLMADAPLDPNIGFQGTRLDLGGMTYHASVIFRF